MKIAILGFGKLGQTILQKVENDADWAAQFQVGWLWNRSPEAFDGISIPSGTRVCSTIEELLSDIEDIDLVIEAAHPSVIHSYGEQILAHTDLFISSPTAFSTPGFHATIVEALSRDGHYCYLPLGASIGVWDVIRLDQNGQLKSLTVTMKKHPDSFRISAPEVVARLEKARQTMGEVEAFSGTVGELNPIAPQNTNTMSIYALAAQSLGFDGCKGRIVADKDLPAHIVHLQVETTLGLTLDLERYNPASHNAVTGSATFSSFLNSVLNHQKGIEHNHFVFC